MNILLPLGDSNQSSPEIIDMLSKYVDIYNKYMVYQNRITDDLINRYPEHKRDEYSYVTKYFYALSRQAIAAFFGKSDSQNARAHIRYLHDSKYKKLIFSIEEKISPESMKVRIREDMTEMPADKSMIHEAYKINRSLVKSLNPEHHFPGKNDNIWKDYITIPLSKGFKDDIKFLSMGISIKYPEKHGELLKFLSFARIELFLQENVSRFNKTCDIMAAINKYEKGWTAQWTE